MILSNNETKIFVELVLNAPSKGAREILHFRLSKSNRTEGQFYLGIIEHASSLDLTTDQRFELMSRLPLRMLRTHLDLPGLLSEEQIKRLPPVTG